MDTVPGLKQLRERKRELLLESRLNRQALRVELESLRFQADQARQRYIRASAAWAWLAPLAGLFLARKFRNPSGVVAKGSFVIGALGALWKAYEAIRKPAPAADSEASPPAS